MKKSAWLGLLKRVHEDQKGAVALETILILGAIALPVLVFLIRWGWPRIRGWFEKGVEGVDQGITDEFPTN